VVERRGRVVALRDGEPAGTFLDIRGFVSTGGERGLLSIAFPPDYESSRRFYVYYTDRNGNIEVDHFRRSPDSAVEAIPDSRVQIITIPHPGASNHNGGTAAFGPDGKLYVATGDGGVRSRNAQDRGSLLGKLLRIDPQPTARRAYRIPNGNPYRGRGGENEIFAVGLRNPFRFSFDRRKPVISIADVGESRFEEVDYLRLSRARGANFGWPAFEGRARRGGGVSGRAHDPPMHVYATAGGNCAITGGVTVRDDALKSLRGRYLYADHCAGELRSFRPELRGNDSRADRALGPDVSSPVAFGEDGDGHVYVASLDGPVYRLAPKG
jgi:glucose/arabinose dehydrogenase